MKKLAWFLLVAVTLAAGVYVFRHLARWEWHRAMFAGMVMIAGEIALVGAIAVRAIHRAASDSARSGAVDERVVQRLRESRAPTKQGFAWLEPDETKFYVFVSILLGGGVLVSAGAWVLDRLGKATSNGGLENRLAARLASLRPPPDGFVVDDASLLAAGRAVDDETVELLLRPHVDGRR